MHSMPVAGKEILRSLSFVDDGLEAYSETVDAVIECADAVLDSAHARV